MILTHLLLTAAVLVVAASGNIDLVTIEQEYASFLRKHGKSLDRLLDVRRLERFRQQRKLIQDHNAELLSESPQKHSFALKLNPMADMLPDEVDQLFGYRNHKKTSPEHKATKKHSLRATNDTQKHTKSEQYYHSNLYPFFGQKKQHPSNLNSDGMKLKMKAAALPESLNWAGADNPIGDSVMSSVRNQGGCGACWAFVAVATTEAALRIALSESITTNQATHNMQGAVESVRTVGYGLLQSSIDGSLGGSAGADSSTSSSIKPPPFDIADDQDMFPMYSSTSSGTSSNSNTDRTTPPFDIADDQDMFPMYGGTSKSSGVSSSSNKDRVTPPFDIADDQDMFRVYGGTAPVTVHTGNSTGTNSDPVIPPFDIADDQDLFSASLAHTTTATSPTTSPTTDYTIPTNITITPYTTSPNNPHSPHLALSPPPAPRMAWIPSLSVQELVDCDTTFNRGCSGGSPLYAFRFIADNGLLPWSRYEYQEKVDVCGIAKASVLPVAKYFIREYGKVGMLDSAALIVAVNRGPVALGVCGTDPRFMLYSTGVFDLDTCCTEQNHAITLVGYGYDEATGLDYWLAQNSWGKMWGESGYIKIKRTDTVGQAGICGMLANPMYGTGGYILDEKGRFIDPTTSPHYPRYVIDMQHWVEDNWREMMLIASALLLCLSLLVLIYACYIERLLFLQSQLRAARMGYTTVPDSVL